MTLAARESKKVDGVVDSNGFSGTQSAFPAVAALPIELRPFPAKPVVCSPGLAADPPSRLVDFLGFRLKKKGKYFFSFLFNLILRELFTSCVYASPFVS